NFIRLSPIKRLRATKAEVEARREALLDIIEAGRPMTVRQVCGGLAAAAARPGELVRPPVRISGSYEIWIGTTASVRLDVEGLDHFSVSSAISFPKSVSVIGIGTSAKSASRAFILGSARTTCIPARTSPPWRRECIPRPRAGRRNGQVRSKR